MTRKNTAEKIFGMIDRERQAYGLALALRWLAAVAAVSLAFKVGLYLLRYPVPGYCWYVGGVSAALLALVFLVGRRSRAKTAVELDTLTASGNRLETAELLRLGNHPLRETQLAEAEIYFQAHPPPRRLCRRLLPPLLAVAVCWPALVFLPDRGRVVVKPETKAADPAKPAKPVDQKQEAKASEEVAELSFIAPESEMRAKPMDEIAFEGQAVSSGGFSEIILHIAVNAKPKKTVKITAANLDRPGKTGLGGEFYLDELEVKPFDLVTYHLSGYSREDREKRRPVVSLPQFIEVRPFREDAFLTNMAGGQSTEMIVKFLQAQIALNKSTFVARAAADKVDSRALLAELRTLEQTQNELGREMTEYINTLDLKTMPANAYYSLKQALEKVRLAGAQLRLAAETLQRVPPPEPEVKTP